MHSLVNKAFSIWFLAIRPKTLIASIAPVLIASSHALKQEVFSLSIFLITLSFACLVQIGTNLTNDYFDYLKGADTADRKGPPRVMQMNLISSKSMKIAILTIFSFCIVLGVIMTMIGGYIFLALSIFAVLCGIVYTAGPYPLAYLGLGDIFVLIFFGPVAVAGSNYLFNNEICMGCFLAGFGPGLFSCAILTANNIRDIEEDKKANKKTLAVRFGKNFAIFEYIFSTTVALAIPVILFLFSYTNLIAIANVALLLLLIEPIADLLSNKSTRIAKVLPKTAHVMTLYTMIFSLSIII